MSKKPAPEDKQARCCSECGRDLPLKSPNGPCARCLLSLAWGSKTMIDKVGAADCRPTDLESFGNYELLAEIAQGGMGVVYKAWHLGLNRAVALKMIRSDQLTRKDQIERFRIEAEAAAGLDHPGIVPVFESGEHLGRHYYTMSFIDGKSLAQSLQEGPWPPIKAAELVKMLTEAVSFAHDRGILHRDLKPANILMDNGKPRITDFGLARRLDHLDALTASGQILGTPSYMPPEQATGNQNAISERSDIYSLGAILYAVLTGAPPFRAATPVDTLAQVLDAEPVPPRLINPSVPSGLEAVCLKCLEKMPNQRYQSARHLTSDLQLFLDGEPVSAESDSSGRFLRFMRKQTRHEEIMRQHAKAWKIQAILILVLSLVTNGCLWLEQDDPWIYFVIWSMGACALFIPGWHYVFRGRSEILPVEKQMISIWWLFTAAAILTCVVMRLRDDPMLDMLPLLMIEFAFAFGCTAVVLRGSFYPLAALCAVAAPLVVFLPAVGPLLCGLFIAIGLSVPAWKHSRLPNEPDKV